MPSAMMDEEDGEALSVSVPAGVSGRLDKILTDLTEDLSRARLQSLIDAGEVSVNDSIVTTASFKVKAGDVIALVVPPPIDATPQPENIPLDIVYEDDDLLVINKPAGLVVHPGAGNSGGTLVNALLYHCKDSLSGIGGVLRPGIVHRLDKETSGLMVAAKNDKAHKGLSEQLADRSLSRSYLAFAWRVPMLPKGAIDAPIGRHPTNRLKMAVRPLNAPGARNAVTHWRREESFAQAIALMRCDLETGRTHQIRVHMQQAGHPLIGDPFYGLPQQEQISLLKKAGAGVAAIEAIPAFPRQALHAADIRFIHPGTGEYMAFSSPLPADLQNLYSIIKTIA